VDPFPRRPINYLSIIINYSEQTHDSFRETRACVRETIPLRYGFGIFSVCRLPRSQTRYPKTACLSAHSCPVGCPREAMFSPFKPTERTARVDFAMRSPRENACAGRTDQRHHIVHIVGRLTRPERRVPLNFAVELYENHEKIVCVMGGGGGAEERVEKRKHFQTCFSFRSLRGSCADEMKTPFPTRRTGAQRLHTRVPKNLYVAIW